MSERQKAQASIENVKSVEKFNFPFLFFRHFKGKPFFPSPSKRCHSKFLVSIRNEAGWNECVGERRMFCAQNEISIQHQKRNMLAKQYGCLLTFVYLFKWNRQMETILGGRNMRDNNFDEQSSFYFFLACVKISHNILLPVIECSFFEITKLNCICSISEM